MMKQRTTFIVSDPEPTNPENLELSTSSLRIKSIPAAREDRFTFTSDELPPELLPALKDWGKFHIRWSTGRSYASVNPYASRVPAGLHVFVTSDHDFGPSIEKLAENVFGSHDIYSYQEAVVKIPGAYQFYHPLKSITDLRQLVEMQLCTLMKKPCNDSLAMFDNADYIDIKYDPVGGDLVVSAFYAKSEVSESVEIHQPSSNDKVEVGILMHEKPMADESFTLGGQVHVIGKKKFNPVLFTFPARHQSHKSFFFLDLSKPTGLHPKLKLSIPSPNPAPQEDCTLNAYFTLPRYLFVDKYQLSTSNPQLLQSLNLTQIRALSGETDLEKPEWESKLWGSSLLVELSPDAASFEIPLHLRYLAPAQNRTMETVEFASPSVFWACKNDEWDKTGNNPFDRTQLGWEQWFSESTVYHYLSPAPGENAWKQIEVPVLGLGSSELIKWGTMVAIFSGFVWVLEKVMKALVQGDQERVGENDKKTQ